MLLGERASGQVSSRHSHDMFLFVFMFPTPFCVCVRVCCRCLPLVMRLPLFFVKMHREEQESSRKRFPVEFGSPDRGDAVALRRFASWSLHDRSPFGRFSPNRFGVATTRSLP